MLAMFKNCFNLKYVDVSNLDTSKVTQMGNMFISCGSLISLDVSNFKTSSLKRMGGMFYGCSSLKSIDLSNFDTSKTNLIDSLFVGCSNLTFINLSNFNTSKVHRMNDMFNNCTSLISIDFQNLDLSLCYDANNIFKNCYNLEYVNIKNFKPKSNARYNYFFKDCPINIVICLNNEILINFIKSNECNTFSCSVNWYNLKKKIYENDKCTDNCTLTNYTYEYKYNCYSSCPNGTYNNNYICENCHEDCKECDGPYTKNNSNCVSCLSENKFLYFGNCINVCPRNSYYYNETISQKICKCELLQCKTCSKESINQNLCTSCDIEEGYYPIYDDLYINNLSFYNCYKSPEGYYLDNESFSYKSCYKSCKNCNKGGDEINNNCLECKFSYGFEFHLDEYKNCYDNCSYYHYLDEKENIFFCTNNGLCPINFNKLIEDRQECISSCEIDNLYKYEFKSKCYRECPPNSSKIEKSDGLSYLNLNKSFFWCKPICNEENPFEIILAQECVEKCNYKEIQNKSCILNYNNFFKEESKLEEIYNNLLKNVEDEFTSEDYNTTNIENGNDDIIELEKIKITLTTTENQKDEEKNNNVTTIDLKECEKILKDTYHIPDEEVLYIKKVDVIQEGFKIPKVEYEVYTKYNRTNLFKLSLSYCDNVKIDISIPIKVEEDIDKYNSSSKYYNDICYTATSDSGTDITLKDRKEEFINNNKTVCQENCIFTEYNYTTGKAKCSCDITVESFSSFSTEYNYTTGKAKCSCDITVESFSSFLNLKLINLNYLKILLI